MGVFYFVFCFLFVFFFVCFCLFVFFVERIFPPFFHIYLLLSFFLIVNDFFLLVFSIHSSSGWNTLPPLFTILYSQFLRVVCAVLNRIKCFFIFYNTFPSFAVPFFFIIFIVFS